MYLVSSKALLTHSRLRRVLATARNGHQGTLQDASHLRGSNSAILLVTGTLNEAKPTEVEPACNRYRLVY